MVIHLDVGREKSIAALDQAMVADKQILLASQQMPRPMTQYRKRSILFGTIAEIQAAVKTSRGTVRVLVEGISRARVENILP